MDEWVHLIVKKPISGQDKENIMVKSRWISLLSSAALLFGLFSTTQVSANGSPPEAKEQTTVSKTQQMPRRKMAIGFDVGYTAGPNPDAELMFQGANAFDNGKKVDMDFFSVGVDFRYMFGRIPFFSNNVRPNAFCGAWARHSVGDTHDEGLSLNLHPTVGNDTFLRVDREGFIMPYCGLGFMSIQQMVELSLFVGARFEFIHLEGITDETGGGGILNNFRDHDTVIAPTVGLEAEMPITIGNNVGVTSMLYFLAAMDYLPSVSVAGTSQTNNFTYNFETDSEWGSRFVGGIRVYFD